MNYILTWVTCSTTTNTGEKTQEFIIFSKYFNQIRIKIYYPHETTPTISCLNPFFTNSGPPESPAIIIYIIFGWNIINQLFTLTWILFSFASAQHIWCDSWCSIFHSSTLIQRQNWYIHLLYNSWQATTFWCSSPSNDYLKYDIQDFRKILNVIDLLHNIIISYFTLYYKIRSVILFKMLYYK